MGKREPKILGIAGGTGSGKTTIADEIFQALGERNAVIIHQDSYYLDWGELPKQERDHINFDHPSDFDWQLFRDHLNALRSGRTVHQPIYDFRVHARTKKTRRVQPRPLIVVEGILIFEDPELRKMMDMKLFVDTDADVRFIRRLQRDVSERGRSLESVVDQYLTTVRPMHLQYVEPARRYADLIIPEGGHNRVALDTVVHYLRALIQAHAKSTPRTKAVRGRRA